MKVTATSTPSSKCSKHTIRRQSHEISKVRQALSVGDVTQQMADETRLLPKEERNELMKEANFNVYIPPEEGLAMKADLCLPWKKLRLMRRCRYIDHVLMHIVNLIKIQIHRWMKSWNITVASERRQRSLMKADLEEMAVEAESVPFSFHTKHGGHEVRPAPLAYVLDLKNIIFHLLEEKDR